jgi:hypothetical protein
VPHGNLKVFITLLYENEFQNPQIFQQTISLFPEHSTLVVVVGKIFVKAVKPHIVVQLYGVPHAILRIFFNV